MSIQKAEAVVLHSRPQGETSKIITLYTREFGKLALMAKGSRSLQSKYLGALESFNHLSIVFYQKEERSLQYLSQATILHPFLNLRSQLGRTVLAAIPCEIVERTEVESRPHAELFDLLLEALSALDTAERGLRNIVRAFILHFASLAGFAPQLYRCRECGAESADSDVFFLLRDGSYLCGACSADGIGKRLSASALQTLRSLAVSSLSAATRRPVSVALGEELDAFLFDYLAVHLEEMKSCRSLKVLHSLQNHLSGEESES